MSNDNKPTRNESGQKHENPNSNQKSQHVPLSRGENKGNVPRMENPPPPPNKNNK